MEKKIIEMIADKLGRDVSNVTLESNFVTDLNADSLDILEMLMSLEEEFQVVVKDEDVASIKTVGDIIKYINNHK